MWWWSDENIGWLIFKLLCIFFFKFESSGKNYLEAFNFTVLVSCSNKENSEKVIKEAISRQYVKKKYFSQMTDKSVPLRRNYLKALVIMSLFLL